MSDQQADKITVSYDELNTRRVDQRLKEQDALARNRQYAAMDETVAAAQAAGGGGRAMGNLWRNTVFALSVFGLIGGLLAWGLGALLQFVPDMEQNSNVRLIAFDGLVKMYDRANNPRPDDRDRPNPEAVRGYVDSAIADGTGANPHFALAVVSRDLEFRRRIVDRHDAAILSIEADIARHEGMLKAATRPAAAGRPATAPADAKKLAEQIRELRGDLAAERQKRDKEVAAGRAANPDFAVMYDPSLPDAAKLEKLKQQVGARDEQMRQILATERTRAFIANLLAYGVRGLIIGCLLAIAVPLTENNIPATIINGSVGAALGLAGGVAAAFVTQLIEASSRGAAEDSAAKFLTTVAVWGALGVFLTLAPGVVMRNPKKLAIGLTGGLIGGLIGGVLYEPIRNATEQPRLGELAAMVAIGLLAGLATGLIEDAAKTGWVKVVQGLIAGKQFILYRNPTFIGASPDCQIYLFKDPRVGKRHAAIHIVPGGFELEDLPLGSETLVNGKPTKRSRLKNGDRIQIGGTQLVFMEKTQAA